MIAVVFIEREEDLQGDPAPGNGVWTRYAGPFTPEEAKAHLTILGPGYRATGENHERS
jgi:hypothetical protein